MAVGPEGTATIALVEDVVEVAQRCLEEEDSEQEQADDWVLVLEFALEKQQISFKFLVSFSLALSSR